MTEKPGQFVDLPAAACGFSYRRSIFNSTQRDRYVVSRVDYRLRKDAPANFVYADLASYFAARNVASPTLAEVRDAVRSIRAQKGMLLVPGDADCRSAGSFFKNPIVPVTELDSVAQDLGIEKQEHSRLSGAGWPGKALRGLADRAGRLSQGLRARRTRASPAAIRLP